MQNKSVSDVVSQTKAMVRSKWDNLGSIEGQNGAFATGHTPAIAPLAYLCRFYSGLSDQQIDVGEAQCTRPIPDAYRQFLKCSNGARLMKVSLYGAIGLVSRDATDAIGQPISLTYQNEHSRPNYIPNGHFGIGGINGNWFSQGDLYLTSTGGVELYNSLHDIIGARWPSFTAFLEEEIARQCELYNPDGSLQKDMRHLPQDTLEWEALGEAHSREIKKKYSPMGKFKRLVGLN